MFFFLLSASSAHAASFYAGIGAGTSTFDDDQQFDISGGLSTHDTVFKIYAGAKINKHFAIEAGYAGLGDYEAKKLLDPTEKTNIKYDTIEIAALGMFTPKRSDITFYGRAGLHNVSMEQTNDSANEDAVGYLLGFGVGVKLNSTTSVRAGFDSYFYEMDHLAWIIEGSSPKHTTSTFNQRISMFSLSANWRFWRQ